MGNFLADSSFGTFRWEKPIGVVVTQFSKEIGLLKFMLSGPSPIGIHGFHSSPQNLPLTFFCRKRKAAEHQKSLELAKKRTDWSYVLIRPKSHDFPYIEG